MVATIFLDWLLSFGLGLLFGRVGARAETRGSLLASRAFVLGVVAEAALLAVSLTLYRLSPQWMWMYWVAPGPMSRWGVALAFAVYPIAFVAGFLLAPELERLRRGAAWWALGLTAAAVTVLEVVAWEELTALGTLREFRAGTAGPLRGTFLVVLVAGGAAVIALTGLLLRALVQRRDSSTASA